MLLERWERVERLFRDALELAPGERVGWLREVTAGDDEIRVEVESLLAADAEVGDRFERLVEEGVRLAARTTAVGVGSRVAGYRLERELGQGGSSTVYLGVAEGSAGERAAVKILRSEGCNPLVRRRFTREGRILGRLEHPGIARLLDAGTLADGRPFVVVEYVEGESLIDFCRRHRLPLEKRLRLFREVCEAVQYAHRNLVIHQDLKPANILVTAEGRPKLLDFGIARLQEPEAAEAGDLTVTADRRLTPSYASPEQLRGEPPSTATDLFSLGVILYELLTDRHPFRGEGQSAAELERAILEQAPKAPSAVVRGGGSDSGRRRARRLAGDLDRVVARAVAKERDQRYGTVERLSEDLRRFLEGRPVTARRATFAYRAAKFFARHRIAVAAALAGLVLLAVFVTVSVLQHRRTARAWAEAEQERRKAEQALAFLVDTFEVAGPDRARGETVTAREILDHGADRIQRELEGQPEVQATLLRALGRVYSQLGLYDRARPLLEKALGQQRRHPGADPVAIAGTLQILGDVLQKMGDYDAAEGSYRRALELRRRHLGERHAGVAESLNQLGDVLHDSGDYAAAEPLYREALALRRELFGARHPAVAESLNNLALLFHERGEYRRAEPLYREALTLRRELLGPDHPDLAASRANLAALLHALGEIEEAETLFRAAVALNERLHGPDSPELAPSLQNLALLLKDQGRLKEAEELLHRVLAIERRQFGEVHPNRATNLYHLGLVKREGGDLPAAAEYFRRAADLYRRSLAADHPWVSFPLLALGELLLEQGRAVEAEPLLRESLRLRRAAHGDDSPLTALAQSALGDCLAARAPADAEPPDEVERLLRESLHFLESAYGPDHRRTRWARQRVERWLGPPPVTRPGTARRPSDRD